MHVREIGIAAGREGAQQVQRRRRLAIGLELALRIGHARFGGEVDVVDDVAAIARQLDAVRLLGRRGARLGELAGDAADLHHRRRRRRRSAPPPSAGTRGRSRGCCRRDARRSSRRSRRPAAGRPRPRRPRASGLQLARLTGKDQRREGRELRLDVGQGLRIRIGRHLLDRLGPPALGVQRSDMTLTPEQKPLLIAETRSAGLYTGCCGIATWISEANGVRVNPLRQKLNSHLRLGAVLDPEPS